MGAIARLLGGLMSTEQQTYEVTKTDEEWRQELSPEQYAVLRKAGTEPAFAGTYTDSEDPGIYHCAACGNALFRSETKFHSGSGWPSFYEPVSADSVVEKRDLSHGMLRTEALCGRCGSHLGHVFNDGPREATGLRYCMNSLSLDLKDQ